MSQFQRPNIVFITCHDLGRHLGCYGITSVNTPELDRIAAEGARFANSFCTSPGCSPSRAAIATGRYPHCNGVLGLAHAHFGWDLSPGERHVAALLAEAGYTTALFGLQHVTYSPERLGFQEIHSERTGDGVANNVDRFLTKRLHGRQPFYLEINFFEPHRPFDFGGVAPDVERGVHVPGYLPDTDGVRAELGAMQGAIAKADACVGRVRAALEGAGVLDNTLLVFTADHGIAFPRAKGTLYDPGIETALLMRWPAAVAPGTRSPLVSNVDLLPTLLEVAGAPVPEAVQGHSLRPLLLGDSYVSRDAIFAEKTFHNEYDPLRCIRTNEYKLIARLEASNPIEVPVDIMRGESYRDMLGAVVEPRAQEFELYDLRSDPLERVNLYARPELAGVARDLRHRLGQWMDQTSDPLLRGPIASPFYYRTIRALRGA